MIDGARKIEEVSLNSNKYRRKEKIEKRKLEEIAFNGYNQTKVQDQKVMNASL